jgi:hypothetical protein
MKGQISVKKKRLALIGLILGIVGLLLGILSFLL